MRMFGGVECMTAEDFPPLDNEKAVKSVGEDKNNMMKLITMNDKGMANGMRDMSKTPLTDAEIEIVKSAIKKIEADETKFIFNNEDYVAKSTCYNYAQDVIYVTRNVFPETKYGSTHPRDIMSVAAVLAHEYYGHRAYRDEYLADAKKGDGSHTTPIWEDECRASITAAKTAPNLTQMDRALLIQDAVFRAREYGQLIEMDEYMKEVVYGYSEHSNPEKNIVGNIPPIHYVSEASQEGVREGRESNRNMPQVPKAPKRHNDLER